MNLEKFLISCDEKRKDNPGFDIINNFRTLDNESQIEILTSINGRL